MDNDLLRFVSMIKHFNSELMELNIKYCEEIEELRNDNQALSSSNSVLSDRILKAIVYNDKNIGNKKLNKILEGNDEDEKI